MTYASPFRKLVQSIEEKGGGKDICVVPQTCSRDSDPWLPESRYAEYQNKEASAQDDEPLRDPEVGICALHDHLGYAQGAQKSP